MEKKTIKRLWDAMLADEKNRKLYHHIHNNKTTIFTRISLKINIAVLIGKVILSFLTLSGFMFANALYSAGIIIARYGTIMVQDKNQNEQINSYSEIGAAIFGASMCYVIYSFSMFTNGKSVKYDLNIAIAIAAYTFTELFLVIKDYIKARKERNLVSEEIKLISLSSTLICFVLTQVAIMSISYEGDAAFYNGLSGIVFGIMAALVGVYMMIRSKFLKKVMK